MSDSEGEMLRERALHRMNGCGLIVKRLRVSENPDDIADGAFLLGALSDISDYVSYLRERGDD